MLKLPLYDRESHRVKRSGDEAVAVALQEFGKECEIYVQDLISKHLYTFVVGDSRKNQLYDTIMGKKHRLNGKDFLVKAKGILSYRVYRSMVEDGIANPVSFAAKKLSRLIEKVQAREAYTMDVFEEMIISNMSYYQLNYGDEKTYSIANRDRVLKAMSKYVEMAYKDPEHKKAAYSAAFTGKFSDLIRSDIKEMLGLVLETSDYMYLEEFGLASGLSIAMFKYGDGGKEMCDAIFHDVQELVPETVRNAVGALAEATLEITDDEDDIKMSLDPVRAFSAPGRVVSLNDYRKSRLIQSAF